MFFDDPVGFEDPFSCSDIRCRITRTVMVIGNRKCSAKNRVSVGLDTENPPHSHSTIVFPMYGTADKKFVITVAPQNDICPHGRTYPRNAVAIIVSRIAIPDVHVSFFVWVDEKYNPRARCVYIMINRIDTVDM